MRLYGTIQKVDTEQRMVWGYASTEAVDGHGETISKTAIEDALGDYMKFANVREMHQLSAVGTAEEATVDDKGLYLAAKVVDDDAWKKVQTGVYKGFSIGGKVLARDSKDKKKITKVRLDEISLVDRPSNPEATFDIWKAAGNTDLRMKETPEAAAEDGGTVLAPEAIAKATETPAVETPAADTPAVETEVVKAAVVETPAAEAPDADVKEIGLDPMAKAGASVDALEALAGVTHPDDLEKGMYAVGRFAECLETLSYITVSAEYEAQSEGDGSPVPANLRDWLKEGAKIFAAMAKEEVDELVSSTKVRKATEAEALARAAKEATDAAVEAAVTEALAKAATDAGDLAKAVTDRDEALAKFATRTDSAIELLTKRLAAMEAQPAPAKTAGPGIAAVSKEADSKGTPDLTRSAGEFSAEDIASALAALPDEERAFLLTKAALAQPRAARWQR